MALRDRHARIEDEYENSTTETDNMVGHPEFGWSTARATRALATFLAATVLVLLALASRGGGAGNSANGPSSRKGGGDIKEVRATVAENGITAMVSFYHDGQEHNYYLSAYSVYIDDAELFEHTQSGKRQLALGPTRTFSAHQNGRRAAARVHEDGTVTGLFQHEGSILKVRPYTDRSAGAEWRFLKAYESGGAAHLVQSLSPSDVFWEPQGFSSEFVGRRLEEADSADFPSVPADGHFPCNDTPVADGGAKTTGPWAGVRWYPGCYENDEKLHQMTIGVITDFKAWYLYKDVVKAKVEEAVLQASFIYLEQMHFQLKIGSFEMYKDDDKGPEWALQCYSDLQQKWNLMGAGGYKFAVTHLFTGCGVDGMLEVAVGLAGQGRLCDESWNLGINVLKRDDSTWEIFAHELGHNIGSSHSFELGQGKTGGIMDYGRKVLLNGVYQFNTKFRKKEVCDHLRAKVQKCGSNFQAIESAGGSTVGSTGGCPQSSTLSPTPIPTSRPTLQPDPEPWASSR